MSATVETLRVIWDLVTAVVQITYPLLFAYAWIRGRKLTFDFTDRRCPDFYFTDR